MILLNEIEDRLAPFKKLYDAIRIIDPLNNLVLNSHFKNNDISPCIESCYKFWNKNKRCKNCIALNAYSKKNTFVKLELKEDKIFLVIATPFEYDNKLYVLELLKNISENSFLEDDSHNTTTLQSLLGSLEESLYKDELTGVFNKRVVYEKISKLLSTKENKDPISLIIIDLDHFKNINDLYGHIIGDKVLKDFSKLVSSCLSTKDVFGRFGGEEFIIILENSPVHIAEKVSEHIRKVIENYTFIYENLTINLTCSIGGYTLYSRSISEDEFIDLADKNLYIVKNNGRNKTLITSE